MSPLFTGVAALGVTALLAGCAPTTQEASAADAPQRTCFLPRLVDSFAAQGVNTVNIRQSRTYYRLNLAETCPEIQEADAIRVIARGGAFVCVGEAAGAEVLAVSKITGPRRCLVRDVQKLTPTEVASLSRREKP